MPTGKEPAILTGVGGLFASIVAIVVANRYNSYMVDLNVLYI